MITDTTVTLRAFTLSPMVRDMYRELIRPRPDGMHVQFVRDCVLLHPLITDAYMGTVTGKTWHRDPLLREVQARLAYKLYLRGAFVREMTRGEG